MPCFECRTVRRRPAPPLPLSSRYRAMLVSESRTTATTFISSTAMDPGVIAESVTTRIIVPVAQAGTLTGSCRFASIELQPGPDIAMDHCEPPAPAIRVGYRSFPRAWLACPMMNWSTLGVPAAPPSFPSGCSANVVRHPESSIGSGHVSCPRFIVLASKPSRLPLCHVSKKPATARPLASSDSRKTSESVGLAKGA